MTQNRITQKQLLARAGRVQDILEEILHKGSKIELNYLEGAYAVFLEDGKGGMSEIAFAPTTACCFQIFRSIYEILWVIADVQKTKKKKVKEVKK
jgi:hypothetical protein